MGKKIKKIKNNVSCCVCPVCGKGRFEAEYDICSVCSWENDPVQYDNPEVRGANHLSLNDYKKRWEKLTSFMPTLMKKYNVKKTKLSHWEYYELCVPRENIRDFVNSLTEQNIGIQLSFYNVCEKYGYDHMTFVGLPLLQGKTVVERNNEALEIVFCNNPIETCKKYKLKQLLEILENGSDVNKDWETLTPNICIEPNPREV